MEKEAIARLATSPGTISINLKRGNRRRKRIIINEDPLQFGYRNYSWDPVHGNASNHKNKKLGTEVKKMTTAAALTYTIPQNPNLVLDSKVGVKVEIFDAESRLI
jgi:hypothetical protein